MTTTREHGSGPVDPIGADLLRTLKALKLGQMSQTLPERLVLARQQKMSHSRVPGAGPQPTRSPAASPARRCCGPAPPGWTRPCGSTPGTNSTTSPTTGNCSPTWPPCGSPRPATACWSSARSGSARPTCATALGHIAIRRRLSVHAARADKLFTRLRAARLDNTLDAELRKLARVDLLILDDFALKPLDANPDQRLLRARRRTAPTRQHHRHLEPGTRRMADHDERRPARPVRRRPAHLRRPHPDHRRPVLPATTTTTGEPTLTTKEASSDAHSHPQVVPCSWQPGGPITLASDTDLRFAAGRAGCAPSGRHADPPPQSDLGDDGHIFASRVGVDAQGVDEAWKPARLRADLRPAAAVCCCTSVRWGLWTDAKPHLTRVEPTGLEPVTPCLQSRCAASCAMAP